MCLCVLSSSFVFFGCVYDQSTWRSAIRDKKYIGRTRCKHWSTSTSTSYSAFGSLSHPLHHSGLLCQVFSSKYRLFIAVLIFFFHFVLELPLLFLFLDVRFQASFGGRYYCILYICSYNDSFFLSIIRIVRQYCWCYYV